MSGPIAGQQPIHAVIWLRQVPLFSELFSIIVLFYVYAALEVVAFDPLGHCSPNSHLRRRLRRTLPIRNSILPKLADLVGWSLCRILADNRLITPLPNRVTGAGYLRRSAGHATRARYS